MCSVLFSWRSDQRCFCYEGGVVSYQIVGWLLVLGGGGATRTAMRRVVMMTEMLGDLQLSIAWAQQLLL